METNENQREELLALSSETLETLIEMRFVWKDSVMRAERDQFYERQWMAEEVLAERRGVRVQRREEKGSIWNRPAPGA